MMLEVIKKRRSIRKYQSRPVEEEKIEAILRSAMYSPSARHTRVWEFIVVTDKKKIKKLGEMKPYSVHVKTAPVVIVVCSKEWQYWLEDASIVAENICLEATNQGLGTCWTQIRGSSTYDGGDPESYIREILDIPDEIRVLCMMPIGYPDEDLPEHQESEFEEKKIHKDGW